MNFLYFLIICGWPLTVMAAWAAGYRQATRIYRYRAVHTINEIGEDAVERLKKLSKENEDLILRVITSNRHKLN